VESSVRNAQSEAIAAIATGRWFGWAMAALRVFFGVVFLHNGLAKILPAVPSLWPDTPLGFVINREGGRSAESIMTYEVITPQHPVEPYRAFIEQVVLPNFAFFGFSIGLLETIVGIMLILGLFTPIAALVAAGMVLHLQFVTLWNDKWIYEYSVEWVPLLCLAVFRAGRWHGLDARIARTRHRWMG
jgi:uncharacterized membrane protein YphA (DoxX/SURF4 family)